MTRCRQNLALLLFAGLPLFLTGCGLVADTAPPTPRAIPELEVRFTPVLPVPEGVIRPEVAIQAARSFDFDLTRPPDVVQYGIAVCTDAERRCGLPSPIGVAEVWLVEWAPSGQGACGIAIVNRFSGLVIMGSFGSGESRLC